HMADHLRLVVTANGGGTAALSLLGDIDCLANLNIPAAQLVDFNQCGLTHPMPLGKAGEALAPFDHMTEHPRFVIVAHITDRRTCLLRCRRVRLDHPGSGAGRSTTVAGSGG